MSENERKVHKCRAKRKSLWGAHIKKNEKKLRQKQADLERYKKSPDWKNYKEIKKPWSGN
jgi:hypothetical protein